MLADCHARAVFAISDYAKTTGVIDHAAGPAERRSWQCLE